MHNKRKTPEQIEDEIHTTERRMHLRLLSIKDALTPDTLAPTFPPGLSASAAGGIADRLAQALRANPGPALLAGTGALWLAWKAGGGTDWVRANPLPAGLMGVAAGAAFASIVTAAHARKGAARTRAEQH